MGYNESDWCVASTFTFDLGYGHCFGIRSRVICAGFVYCHCTGSWAVLDNTYGDDGGALPLDCCTATTMALTSIKQKKMTVHAAAV